MKTLILAPLLTFSLLSLFVWTIGQSLSIPKNSVKQSPTVLKIMPSEQHVTKDMNRSISSIDQDILTISKKYDVDPKWVAAVIWTESHFKKTAGSSIGAVGLMQITHPTAKYICKRLLKESDCSYVDDRQEFTSLFQANTKLNITYGVVYLKYLKTKFNNNHKLATLAYNEGPNKIRRLKHKITTKQIFTEHQYFVKIDKRMKLIAAL